MRMEWWDRLNRQMAELGMSMAELHRRSGVSYDNINKYVHGDVSQPRGDAMARLAKALEVTELWLRDGIDTKQANVRIRTKTLDSAEEPRILELDFRGGSGGAGMDAYSINTTGEGGITISADAVSAEWRIPAIYLRGQLRINPAKAWIVEIYGDSMYDPSNPAAPGSLFPGDRVVVDTGDIRPSPPGAFAVFDGVGLVIKLVEVLPLTTPVRLRLSSRNPTYQPYEVVEDEGRVIGRVRGRISAM